MGTINRSFRNTGQALMLSLCLVVWIGHPADAGEIEEIYLYVASEMAVEKVPAPPQVYFVDKDALRTAFQENIHTAFMRWKAQYGEDEARRAMRRYMQDLVGLFVSNSETIYVDASLPPCRRRAALAHEFCHFFQYIMEGAISQDLYQTDILYMIREMRAYKLEHQYMAAYCAGP
jgi:hypothetical protein